MDEAKFGDDAADDTAIDTAAVEENAVYDASEDDAAVGGIISDGLSLSSFCTCSV